MARGAHAIVFKSTIINSNHTFSDSLHRRGVTLSLETYMGDKDNTECSATELTP
jgi:hypothetical protein